MKKNFFQKIKNFDFQNISFFAMRSISNKYLRDTAINWMASRRGKNYEVDKNVKSNLIDFDNIDTHIQNMNVNGFTVFDYKLSTDKLNSIFSYIEKLNCYDPYRKNLGNIDINDAPKETHIAHYERAELVKNLDISDIANDSGILAIAQEFIGATPTISNVNAWWSFGGRQQAEEAQLYHRDVDDWKFCKCFIYLTDVNVDNGPHIYVKGTSASPKLRKIRRYEDKEIEDTFGKENVMKFVEPRGTAFMVDTYGFHKGLLPKNGRRLLLQIQYSLNPIEIEKYVPIEINNFKYDKFINRLFIK